MLLSAELINKRMKKCFRLQHTSLGHLDDMKIFGLFRRNLFITVSENSPEAYNQQAKTRASEVIRTNCNELLCIHL